MSVCEWVCVGWWSSLKLHQRRALWLKNSIYLHDMERTEEKNLTTPVVSDATGVGVCRGIVPAPMVSSSGEGLDAVLMAGTASERTTAAPERRECTSFACDGGFSVHGCP